MPKARGRAGGWRKGRGLLGVLDPLIGPWQATAVTPMGAARVERVFSRVLGGRWVRLEARWFIGSGVYEEVAFFGRRPDGTLGFWSFTSDGKRSEGWLAEAPDLPAGAIAFEADMPAGRARFAYWPRTADDPGETAADEAAAGETAADEAIAGEIAAMGDDTAADDGAGFVFVVEARTTRGWSRFTEHRHRPAPAAKPAPVRTSARADPGTS